MPAISVCLVVALCIVANLPVAVHSFRIVPGWQLTASTRLRLGHLDCKPLGAAPDAGAIDSTGGDAGASGNPAIQTQRSQKDDATIVSAAEFAGIDSEDFYDYNDEESDSVTDGGFDGPLFLSKRTQAFIAKVDECVLRLSEQQRALQEKEELLATEYALLKKLQTLRDRGEFVHEDLRTKEALCKAEESLRDGLKSQIQAAQIEMERLELQMELSRDADDEESDHRRRKRLRQELQAVADRDTWLGIKDPLPTPLSVPDQSPLPAAQVAVTMEAEAVALSTRSNEAFPSVLTTVVEAEPKQVQSAEVNVPATAPTTTTVGTEWDWQAVRSWDETTAAATAADAGWVALRSAVLLSLGLVDVATGYVTSSEVVEVVQALVGAGTSLADIAQSTGDAWQSGAEVWKAQVADSLDAQSSVKDVLLTTLLGVKGVICSPPVRKSLGHIGKILATSATSLASSGVHTSQRVCREFEASEQWNKGIKGLQASVPLLCALVAASAVKSVDEVIKSLL